ncbi:MAG: TlpA family protein disulfide reductase [Chloroflexota bacterium]|nr:TlpA family protein disulfide reductase [Chloroflexota bacterium]
MSTLTVGQTAPKFSLSGIDERSYELGKDGARLTLAVFFKTTCPTCILTWRYIEKIHQQFRDAGLAVWGISQDARDVSAEFASKYGNTFPILIDTDWRVSRAYDPEFVPMLLLIDSDNRIIDRVVAFDKAGLNRLAQVIAARLEAPAAVIAPPDDGNPPFKPG